jgi:uncharacterized protein
LYENNPSTNPANIPQLRSFLWRDRTTALYLDDHLPFGCHMKKLVIAGGSGSLGQVLARYFREQNWRVVILTRSPRESDEVLWDGKTIGSWKSEIDGAEAVINLAGKSVDCRYTSRNRAEILSSRIDSTRSIGKAIQQCTRPPRVWLNSSTATIYKHTFGPAHDESGEIGAHPDADDAFSIKVATQWERALAEVSTPKTRKIALRAAMVLGHGRNSVFPTLRRLVKCGLGGRMSSGKQFVSWIHEADFARAIQWIIEHDDLDGPINVAAPEPITNDEMMRTLREILRVPIGLPASRWMLDIGAFLLRTEVELIIKSRRVVPGRLAKSGFQFEFTKMRQAFLDLANSSNIRTRPIKIANDGRAAQKREWRQI